MSCRGKTPGMDKVTKPCLSLSTTVPLADVLKLRRLAYELEISVQDVIRQIIRGFLDTSGFEFDSLV